MGHLCSFSQGLIPAGKTQTMTMALAPLGFLPLCSYLGL